MARIRLLLGAAVLSLSIATVGATSSPERSAAPPTAPKAEAAYWKQRGCDRGYRLRDARRGLRANMRPYAPMTQRRGRRAHRWVACVHTRAHHQRMVAKLAAWKRWRRTVVWRIRLAGMPAGWVQWAKNITACESTWNRYASNGTHFSYFQWASSTWYAAGGTGSPYGASWPHQAVLAIRWAWKAGTSQWACSG